MNQWWSFFILGLLVIPAGLLVLAACIIPLWGILWAWANWGAADWKLWPRKARKADIAATIATAKRVRYVWIPGVHIVFARTHPLGKNHDGHFSLFLRIRTLVQNELYKSEES